MRNVTILSTATPFALVTTITALFTRLSYSKDRKGEYAMRITWRDAVTTLSTGGAIVLERAYSHSYDWPLVYSIRWIVAGLAILTAVNLAFGFAFDKLSNDNWDALGIILGIGLAMLTLLGIVDATSGYVLALTFSAVMVWLVSLAHHFIEQAVPKTLYRT